METEDAKEQWKCANLCMTSFCSSVSCKLVQWYEHYCVSWTPVHWYMSWTLLHELDTGKLVCELDTGRLLRDIDTGT